MASGGSVAREIVQGRQVLEGAAFLLTSVPLEVPAGATARSLRR